jgi:subtilase family serine protease
MKCRRQISSEGQILRRRRLTVYQLLESLESRVLLDVVSPISNTITVNQMRNAYGMNSVFFGENRGDGTGQTIAIIDAAHFSWDTGEKTLDVAGDLDEFDTYFVFDDGSTQSLYQRYGPASSFLTVNMMSSGLKNDVYWAYEIMMDVEWAHAMAPGAKIILFEANTFDDVFTAVQTALQDSTVSVVSMSFDAWSGLNQSGNHLFQVPGVTFIASSGDNGFHNIAYPASLPDVIAVGGTVLSLDTNSCFTQTGWRNSGGGEETGEMVPSYQTNLQISSPNGQHTTNGRATPDIALCAAAFNDQNYAVSVYDSFSENGTYGHWYGGWETSLAAPMFAGMVAVINQGRISNGFANLNSADLHAALYSLPRDDFYDVTEGLYEGCQAGPGYDLVTGLGAPNGPAFVTDLASWVVYHSAGNGSTITVSQGSGTLTIAEGTSNTQITLPVGGSAGFTIDAGTCNETINLSGLGAGGGFARGNWERSR